MLQKIIVKELCVIANTQLVKENMQKHNPTSPFLIGELEEEDVITVAKQNSWKKTSEQISLDI